MIRADYHEPVPLSTINPRAGETATKLDIEIDRHLLSRLTPL
ncbi:hypothetical protein [Kamptonema formosum]|nr:hypothetical protein [Oscillatoria sp. PCC 10802]